LWHDKSQEALEELPLPKSRKVLIIAFIVESLESVDWARNCTRFIIRACEFLCSIITDNTLLECLKLLMLDSQSTTLIYSLSSSSLQRHCSGDVFRSFVSFIDFVAILDIGVSVNNLI
jgi:hypothetical protein